MVIVRTFILLTGWPFLILVSVYLGHWFFKLRREKNIPHITWPLFYIVIAWLITMYGFGISVTILLFDNLEKGVSIIMPAYILWLFLTLGLVLFVPRWRRELVVYADRDRKLEEDVHKEIKELSVIIDKAPIGIYTLDDKGQIETFNPKMVELSGAKSEKAVIGMNVFKLPSYKSAGLDKFFRKGFDSGEPFDTEVRYVSYSAGKVTWRHYRGVPLFDASNKKVTRLLLMVEDITRRKQLEEEHIRIITNNAPIVFFSVDKEGIFTMSEGKGLEWLGLNPGEVVGTSVYEFYRDVPLIEKNIKRALSGETFVLDTYVKGRIFETWYSPEINEKGEISGVIGVATDVTESKSALAEANKLASVIENSFEGVIIATGKREDFLITYANLAWERITGWDREEVVGKLGPSILNSGKMEKVFFEDMWKKLNVGETFRSEMINKRKDGTLYYVEVVIFQIHDEKGERAYVEVSRDITNRKSVENELRSKNKELEKIVRIMVGREADMMKMKKEMAELKKQVGKKG